MATHARMADPKTPDEGDGPLKNGTASLEDSDDSSGGVLSKNRVRSPAAGQHNREMDGFQDGGPPPSNRPAAASIEGGYPQSGDQRPQHYTQQANFNNNNSGGGNPEEFRPQEYNCGEMGGAYRGGGFDQQHGGQGNCGEMTTNSQSGGKMYPQYNSQMRPPFSPRGQQRAPYPGGSRFVSGPSLSQQTGPTPTLNQLLQAPNSLQRYPQHNSYDYPNQKSGDPGGPHHYPGPNNTWGGGRYPQQHSTMYRNQQGDPSLKRPYPGQMSSPGAQQQQPYPQQQYHPYSTTPPSSQGAPRHNYPQQSVQAQYPGVQGQPPPMPTSAGSGYEGAPRPQMPPYVASSGQSTPSPQQPPPSQPPQQAAPPQQPTSQHLASPQQVPPQQPPTPQQPQQDGCEEGGSSSSEAPSSTAAPLRTTPPHPGVSPHRPAPSPSGSSTGSPSMSPALGQPPPTIPMPPRPSSTQSESSGQAPAPPQGYNQQMAPPGMYGNKMHPNMMGSSHMPPYSPSTHYPQGGYHRAPGSLQMHGYSGQSQNSSYPGPSYPGQPPQQHRVPPSNYAAPPSTAYNSQPYPSTGPAPATGYNTMNSMMPPPNQYPKSASMPPPPAAAGAQAAAQAAVIAAAASSGGSARQSPMYLRQHLQQKMYNNSYGGPPEGPPMPPPTSSSSQPPCDFASNSTIGLPPTTVTQSISSPVPSTVTVSSPSDMMQSPRNSMGPGPPLMDEGSQASNASASSSLPEERVETPKPVSSTNHKQQQLISHPATPSALPSPGAASMSSFHDDFESVSSPSWPRTPASPVINNQPYDHHPIKRPDGMLKLYDMSEEPERRLFLDKLIVYQEERGTPLSQCPTISKQPLDLYRLYLAAKERGGFVEVMKGKMWKEIAGLVGIGASSSAAYTLRKQYIKHLLPFECKFDRGGIDPVPLISSLESNSRKKNAKNAGGPMMDGYPGPYPGGYPPNTGPHPGMIPGADYPGHHPSYPDAMHHPGSTMVNHSGSEGAMDPFSDDMQGGAAPSQYPQRHNSEGGYASYPPPATSTMPPYPGSGPSTAFGYGGGGQQDPPQQPPYSEQYPGAMAPSSESTGGYTGGRVPPDPYAPPPGGYPPNRTVGPSNSSQYPPYQNPCGDQERFGESQNTAPNPMIRPSTPNSSVIGPSSQQDSSPYPSPHRYPSQPGRDAMPQQPMGAYQGRPPLGPTQYPSSQPSGPYAQQDSYGRGPEFQNYPPSQQQSQGGMYGGAQGGMPPPNKVAPPGSIPAANLYQRGGDMYQVGPKRHPDYAKGHDQYHHYPQQTPPSQAPYSDRSQYPYRPTHGMPPQSAGPPPTPSPQQGWPRESRSYVSAQYPPNQRDNWDMSRHGDGPAQPGTAPWARYGGPQSEPYPHHMGPSLGPKMMNRSFGPNKMTPHGGPPPQYTPPNQQRREVIFPPDTVEAVSPLITKRRRVLAKDISPVDPWRLMMALKSGLLGESTWALDALAILIHDDATVLYFGLGHLQGLLEVLMDHYRRCLNLVFSDLAGDTEVGCTTAPLDKEREKKWYELNRDIKTDVEVETDVTALAGTLDTGGERTTLLLDTPNYTHRTRCRKAVRTQEEQALFLFDPDRRWDVHEGFISGSSHWQHGGGEHTGYIQTHFEDTEKRVRFVRVLEDCTKDKPRNGGLRDSRRECGSDTEEDENPNAGSPKSLGHDKCEDVNRISKDLCRKDDFLMESAESVNMTLKNISESSKRTCDLETQKSDTKSEVDSSKVLEVLSNNEFPKIRPVSPSRKRRALEDLEDESYTRDEPSLCTMTDAQDSLARRCIAASSILRNLSFVPGNDTEMSKHSGFLLVMGRLLLLNHVHSPRRPPQRHYDREEEGETTATSTADSCSSLSGEREWWWDALHIIRENTLVTLANIAGQLDLAPFPEEISFPILDGLMHWVTCPSSHAQDPLPTQPPHSVLSPQRLSLEALSKLSVLESNVDLMMATPPWDRIDRFFALLSKWLSRNEDQVLREFSVVLLSNLSQADSAMARAIALQGACIPLLITFVEQAEQSALQVANAQGINALRENPELMGTTLDMVRRAAGTLRCLARVPSNRTLFLQHQNRLLALVMSQILDQGVASIVADVLYECSQEEEGASSSLATEDT